VSRAGRCGLGLLLAGLVCCAAGPGAQLPPHHGEEGFRNPYVERKKTSPFAYWRMRWFGDVEFPDPAEAKGKIPVVAADLERIQHPPAAPQATWIGHATVLIQYRGINILTDPIFSQRASPTSFIGPKRLTPPALTTEQLPRIDFVVISHNHYDHLDRPSVRALGDGPRWLVPLGLKAWFAKAGIDPARVEEFDWWQERRFGGLTVTATPLQHWSARSPWDRYETLWAGWALQIGDFSAWFVGDTGYNEHQFREIGERLGPFDLALLPIGAYAPRWFMQEVHINPEEAVHIHRDVRARHSIGIQWGAFILTAEPVDEPPRALAAAREKHGIAESEFETLKVGETRVLAVGR
jgi:N-acyl-phosphatidylethanolamine-hydrolysing phospholipase D